MIGVVVVDLEIVEIVASPVVVVVVVVVVVAAAAVAAPAGAEIFEIAASLVDSDTVVAEDFALALIFFAGDESWLP